MEQRLSLISLGVKDMANSRAFYEKLGWVASASSTADVTFFQLGGLILGLYGLGALAAEAGQSPGSGFDGITLAHNARSKAEVDTLLAEAKAAGGQILKPAEEVFWGGYSGYFADPDNHAWEIAWNPFFPIADDGTISMPD
ncbi:MAG: VOC family protein [Rhodospirillales bacterium]|nr:VOC family protein [Rhodospirillales bacterium]